jgi:hypothetical protein
MILLELTEKEAQLLLGAITDFRNFNDDSFSEKKQEINRKNTETCDSILNKLELASSPQSDSLITAKDFFYIKSLAKDEYLRLPQDAYLSKERIPEQDFRNISIANAVIMWLNGKGLLKKLAKFDYTDTSTEFEGTEE